MSRILAGVTGSRRVPVLVLAGATVLVGAAGTRSLLAEHHDAAVRHLLGVQLLANNGCGNGSGGPSGSKDCANPAKTFTMTGTSSGLLAPGVTRTLTVRVNNPNSQDMYVTQITSSVSAPSGAGTAPGKPSCNQSWVVAPGYVYSASGPKYVSPAGGYVDVPLSITLSDLKSVNEDNCKGAQFPITLTATADQVH